MTAELGSGGKEDGVTIRLKPSEQRVDKETYARVKTLDGLIEECNRQDQPSILVKCSTLKALRAFILHQGRTIQALQEVDDGK